MTVTDEGSWVTLSERNAYEVHAELLRRVANLEAALLALAQHTDAVDAELQQKLDAIREASSNTG